MLFAEAVARVRDGIEQRVAARVQEFGNAGDFVAVLGGADYLLAGPHAHSHFPVHPAGVVGRGARSSWQRRIWKRSRNWDSKRSAEARERKGPK